ncbi:MAG: DegT/DnrJ/EryC1/StrS family aminotransferase [Candidatus Taylorbacteria bacterium]|nr:DegT/DnrJ/EryC1/StrS family aminotransferase [Candidatus Taylorbacteria bacterium]
MPSNSTIKFIDFNRKYKRYKKEINSSVGRVFKRGWFVGGPERAEFENKFCRYLDAKYAVGVNSGTDSIAIALKSAGINPGDEVITTSHTATPTISAIRITGAIPVFVDIDSSTLNIDSKLIEKKINSRTKAILPVHLYGYPADMDVICKLADKHNLLVIEDACQAHGAKFKGRAVGTIGDVGCFSFYPTKNLGAFGDAGAIVTNNKKIAETAVMLRNFGEVGKYKNKIEGVNSGMDELQAAFLSWELNELNKWNKERAQIAETYFKNLIGLPIKLPPKGDVKHNRVWHLFVIQVARRDSLRKFLKEQGIDTSIHYPTPVFKQEAYRFLKYTEKDLPITVKTVNNILSLPIYPELKILEATTICDKIRKFYGQHNAI